jgi:hypothetical protein
MTNPISINIRSIHIMVLYKKEVMGELAVEKCTMLDWNILICQITRDHKVHVKKTQKSIQIQRGSYWPRVGELTL